VANTLFIPTQYLTMGKTAKWEEGRWVFSLRFDYSTHFIPSTVAYSLTVIPTFILGTTVKALALTQNKTRERYFSMKESLESPEIHLNDDLYLSYGIEKNQSKESGYLTSEGYTRRPGDENHLKLEKEALGLIGDLLNNAGIIWWLDCGSCLGAYRYGGVIPWDEDIDIAVLLPDHDNLLHLLNRLDKKKYRVQDWSSRDHPNSYLKVLVRETSTYIDIYHYKIIPQTHQLQYILALENAYFLPEWWKIRERRFTVPVDISTVFPLKQAVFDGISVYVPNDTQKYLHRFYDKNLAPAKIYDSLTGQYEKDLTHPYWEKAYVH